MNKNVGSVDKKVRVAVGVLLVVLAIMGTIGWWGWLGVVLIITGSMNYCPAYSLLGVNTSKKE